MKNMKRLYRNMATGTVSGVCSGLAEYFDVDVSLLRILMLLLIFFSGGTALIFYVAAWMIMPTKTDVYRQKRESNKRKKERE